MRAEPLWVLVLSLSNVVYGIIVQSPNPHEGQIPFESMREAVDLDWDVEPHVDETGHLVFNSVSSLLLR